MRLPLFPLHTVLFPGGVLPLRIFEQRYIAMVKGAIADGSPFGVCLILAGDEVIRDPAAREAPETATIGTLATISDWDMPAAGILHVRAQGGQRFAVVEHSVAADGLVTAEATLVPPEPAHTVEPAFAPLVRLLELIEARVDEQQYPAERHHDDASWVGYRIAELLPLPLPIKQSMLEINDSQVRLSVLQRFLAERGVL